VLLASSCFFVMRPLLFWLALLAALLSRPGLHAQALPEVIVLGHAGKHTGVLRQLHLSPAQVVRINTLIDEDKAQRKQRLTYRPDETEHARRQAQEADFETKIEAVLTPAQRDKYEELRGLKPARALPEMRVPGQ
jgi:Spy/CpxP family protein refolding chaperone